MLWLNWCKYWETYKKAILKIYKNNFAYEPNPLHGSTSVESIWYWNVSFDKTLDFEQRLIAVWNSVNLKGQVKHCKQIISKMDYYAAHSVFLLKQHFRYEKNRQIALMKAVLFINYLKSSVSISTPRSEFLFQRFQSSKHLERIFSMQKMWNAQKYGTFRTIWKCQNQFDSLNTFFLFRNTHRYGVHNFLGSDK